MAVRGFLFAAFVHAIAAGAVIVGTLLLAVVGYFGMFAWAVFAGEPIGGILALPFMMLLALAGSVAASILVLFPVTLTTSILCDGPLQWPRVAQIPVATAFCVLEVLLLAAVGALWRHTGLAPALTAGLTLALVLLVPLGLYWWVLQAGDGLRRLSLAIWNRLRGPGATGSMDQLAR